MRREMSWERLIVGMGIMFCASSSGLSRKTSALFARLLHSPSCCVWVNTYVLTVPIVIFWTIILATLSEV